jgi:hypothetical protein
LSQIGSNPRHASIQSNNLAAAFKKHRRKNKSYAFQVEKELLEAMRQANKFKVLNANTA